MKQEEIEMQLWEYIDGSCNEADRLRISNLVTSDPTWQQQYEELATLHHAIAGNLELEHPPMRFTKNVMEAVAQTQIAPATKKYINRSIIKGIAAFFIITIVSLLGYALATANWHTGTPGIIPKINLASIFNSSFFYVIIAVNIVLALLLLDMGLRRKQMSHHQ